MENKTVSSKSKKSREIILKEAFKLFLQKNVEKVTVIELEHATKLHRGAIFHYFKDKKSIFTEVINYYFFSSLNVFYPLNPDDIFSLNEYWDKKNAQLKKTINWFIKENMCINPYFAFSHLAGQAYLCTPSFQEKILELINIDKSYWQRVAKSDSIVKKCKLDINLVSDIFRGAYVVQSQIACFSEEKNECYYPNIFLEHLSKLYGLKEG